LEGLGAEAVELVTEFKLGATQLLAIRLAGQQTGEASGFVKEGLLEQLVEVLGFGFLLGGEGRVGHEGTPCA
jgi:hypothetical protein